jgi:2-dehydropantoate 2-reductase
MTKRVAIIGAGAVGAVYGRHIRRAGSELTFVVRPKYVDEVKKGIRLYKGKYDEVLQADHVVGDVAELKGKELQQVWLCVPSTGLTVDDVQKIADCTGDALVVDMAPGLDGATKRIVGAKRHVDGLIPFISYQTPLPNVAAEANRAPGIAYWLPPLFPTTLSGVDAKRAANVIKRGGMSARVVADAAKGRAVGSALLMGAIATLELSDWSLAKCRKRLDGAVREAVDAMAALNGISAAAPKLLASPFFMRMVLWWAPKLAPLPLEPYLAYHFTKVGKQTRLMMKGFVDAADKAGHPAPHLRALAAALPPM